MSSWLPIAALLALGGCAPALTEGGAVSTVPPLRQGAVRAPELEGGGSWINTDRPLTVKGDLRGRVVLIDFWTSGCINCLHAIPELKALEHTFADAPFQVIGIHSGKFDAEKGDAHVRQSVARYGIEHPVLTDPDFTLWNAYAVKGWPTFVILDAEGYVVAHGSGEPDRAKLERLIGALLENAEARKTAAAGPLTLHRPASAPTGPLAFPGKVCALDGDRLAVADTDHHRVLVLSAEGAPLAVIGSGEEGLVDGDFADARFRRPQGLVGSGGLLFVADTGNHAIRRIDLRAKTVTTIAGTGRKGRSNLVPGTPPLEQELRSPWDLALVGDPAAKSGSATLYIAMAGIHQIWSLDLGANRLDVLAGSGAEALVDGIGEEAAFSQPSGLATDGKTLYVADAEDSAVRAIDLAGRKVRTLVGTGLFDFGDADGRGSGARLQHPQGVALLGNALYVADTFNGKVRRIALDSLEVSSVTKAGALAAPGGLAAVGNALVVADSDHHRLVRVDPATGAITPIELPAVPAPQARTVAPASGEPEAGPDKKCLTPSRGEPEAGPDKKRLTPSRVTPPLPVQPLGSGALPPGDGEVVLTISLPAGAHWSDEAPTTVTLAGLDGPGLHPAGAVTLRRQAQTLEIRAPVRVDPGAHGTLRLVSSLFYCTEAAGVCLVDRRELSVALSEDAHAPRALALAYRPSPLAP